MKKPIRQALISVYYKEGLDLIVKKLHESGVTIYSTGGTQGFIEGLGIPVISVEKLTGFPEMLGGRVKTLHPIVFGGILGRRENEKDQAQMKEHNIPPLDLVIVDLYPFEETLKTTTDEAEIIEKIDIGGISLIRAAAKNFNDVLTVSSRGQYGEILELLNSKNCETDIEDRKHFAGEAFMVATHYDALITEYFLGDKYQIGCFEKADTFCYGENHYQAPSYLFTAYGKAKDPLGLPAAVQLEGKTKSFNNACDFDSGMQLMTHIAAGYDLNFGSVPKIAIGLKHGNPCGAAVGESAEEVIKKMVTGNLKSIFGGSVIFNFELTDELVNTLLTAYVQKGNRMLDMVVAPGYSPSALEIVGKREKCRVVSLPGLATLSRNSLDKEIRSRFVRGGKATQPNYTYILDLKDQRMTKQGEMSEAMKRDAILAWAINCTSNSNTISIVKDNQLLGNGVGQQDRVEAAELAIKRALDGLNQVRTSENPDSEPITTLIGAFAASDSFFPFPDGPLTLLRSGISGIFATNGSVKDADVLAAIKAESPDAVVWQLPDSVARGFAKH